MPPRESKSSKEICTWCNENNGEKVDGRVLCEDCIDEFFISCESCSHLVDIDSSHYAFGDTYCEDCFYEHYTHCVECSDVLGNTDVFYYNGDGYCEHCYDENYRADMPDAFINKTLPASSRFSDNRNFHVNKLVGIEVECCISNSVEWERSLRYWQTTSDGSIDSASDYYGIELVSSPAQGDALLESINSLIDWRENMQSEFGKESVHVNQSCGLHIHFNSLDYSAKEVAYIGIVYKRLEGLIKQIMPPSRQDSRWCKDFGDVISYKSLRSIDSEQELVDLYYEGMDSQPSTEKYNDARYCALNLHSRYYHGTLEFRLHSGTTNKAKIINWITILNSIIDKGLELSKLGDKECEKWLLRSNLNLSEIFSINIIEYINKRKAKFNRS